MRSLRRLLKQQKSVMKLNNKNYILKYSSPAPHNNDGIDSVPYMGELKIPENDGWHNWAFPIGNGHLGAMVFGRIEKERIQITENSFANPMYEPTCGAGLNNLAEIGIAFKHKRSVNAYERSLNLNDGIVRVEYETDDVRFKREYFASYPSKLIAIKLSADRKGELSFCLNAEIPFLRNYCVQPGDGMRKSGKISTTDYTLTLESMLDYYKVIAELQVRVRCDGECRNDESSCLIIENSTTAEIYIAAGTNYVLSPKIFLESRPGYKLDGNSHPHKKVCDVINQAMAKSYEELRNEHIADYTRLFERVRLDIGGTDNNFYADSLKEELQSENGNLYGEELAFQYGRYLLISSSRPGALPSNLQGIWNRYADTPWTGGYWHNINIQMNYWLSMSCNLKELFLPYVDYFEAILPVARKRADDFILKYFPEQFSESGKNGWAIGTGAWPYDIYGISTEDHSGPGTIGLTALLFWDWYEYTQDQRVLEKVYGIFREAALFLSKVMVFNNGKWLVRYSASCEQWENGKTYRTVGCSFDQQMCAEVFKNTLESAEVLGIEKDSFLEMLGERLLLLDPYPIGTDGQVKEFREENAYGEIGEKHHRHLSHLLGIFPGSGLQPDNGKLKEAVCQTLKLRGSGECGWASANRACLWARVGCGNEAYENLRDMEKYYFMNNFLNGAVDGSQVFQIDGNFGYSAAVAEMLLQSDNNVLRLLPALPENWSTGSFDGLTARGGFEVSCHWENRKIVGLEILSLSGNELCLRDFSVKRVTSDNKEIAFVCRNGKLFLKTEKEKLYCFEVEDL